MEVKGIKQGLQKLKNLVITREESGWFMSKNTT